ncbi:MAG TPA: hypothetical protein VJW17_16950 [Pyrinomonadaceae bacterium]|nr:hypothetical protein [Pyrinomonadaceae bacterium]
MTLNPICLRDKGGFFVNFFNSSNTKHLSCVESFLMTAENFRLSSSLVSSICLKRTKARMMAMAAEMKDGLREIGVICG